jgi:predicted acetyltransferase
MKIKALSIVAPSGTKIAKGEKIIEVRSWKPTVSVGEDLLIVENRKFLREDGETDLEGKAVALVQIKSVREYLESDISGACASRWEPGYLSWDLTNIRPLSSAKSVLAARGIYEIEMPPILKIQRPSVSLYASFLDFIDDMRSHQQPLWEPYLPKPGEMAEDFIDRLLKRETLPEATLVPETIYWAIYDGYVVGRISIRHRLEGNLKKIGGHIGYEVSPAWRRKGFATEMLRQVLETSKAKEIGRLLLTCSPDNEASNKTILSNGGKFEKSVFVDFIGQDRNHYWIGGS